MCLHVLMRHVSLSENNTVLHHYFLRGQWPYWADCPSSCTYSNIICLAVWVVTSSYKHYHFCKIFNYRCTLLSSSYHRGELISNLCSRQFSLMSTLAYALDNRLTCPHFGTVRYEAGLTISVSSCSMKGWTQNPTIDE